MMSVVADKTGYPSEMLELEMDMEADLGIDSIKRVEILGAVQETIPDLPELNPEDLAELGLELLKKNLSVDNINIIISIYINNIDKVYTYNVQDIVKLIDKYDYRLYCQLINMYCLTNNINIAY